MNNRVSNNYVPNDYTHQETHQRQYTQQKQQIQIQIPLMTKILRGVLYGFIAGLVIIIIWWIWAVTSYRWSESRISSKLSFKYGSKNIAEFEDDNKYLDVSNVVISPDKTFATATMLIKNKKNGDIIKSEFVRYSLTTDRQLCEIYDTTDCLLL